MLELTLREEFQDRRLKGTAIELSNGSNTGATQIAADQFLKITYPTHDLILELLQHSQTMLLLDEYRRIT
ncbi:hypothetical protein [Verminephrobacter aporrectodeae]|uniref:hypothetical protein n=1 Tax=Verminephrobacter aporrectodeae TaxID=1110389 RepID=UPI00224356E5|nr:hypothetical protein [Verminephrobacter aporrectodeae]MCW8174448.1 hypothetical protein [Verminephrobacter aporrectodeae subsp. tuberculatae]MCW8201787.1 hypothetical protein [Verminephrobacter aporrectodeae subsp. tuberculatae]